MNVNSEDGEENRHASSMTEDCESTLNIFEGEENQQRSCVIVYGMEMVKSLMSLQSMLGMFRSIFNVCNCYRIVDHICCKM